VAATQVALAGNARSVAVGASNGDFACALLAGGTVQCWGDDDFEQLGSPAGPCINSASGARTCSLVPVMVPGINDATSVALGQRFACALSVDGEITCWGANDAGVLGMTVPLGSMSAPVPVATGAVTMAAGGETVCAQMSDLSWRCWGADISEVDASGNPAAAPQGWNPQTDGAVALGFGPGAPFFGCALWADGTVRCFGAVPWSTDTGAVVSPVVVASVPPIVRMAVGADYVCGITGDGEVVCWGDNRFSQIGTPSSTAPVPPTMVPGVAAAVQVVVGDVSGGFACALLNNGTVTCWGSDFTGTLGGAGLRPVMGTSYACNESDWQEDPCSAPVPIGGVLNVTQVAAGAGTCALTAEGAVECWGLAF
jgi:alpha-tubulin suppressor-like RCC1 family protein